MIKRRICETVAVKCVSLPSTWRGQLRHARRPAPSHTPFLKFVVRGRSATTEHRKAAGLVRSKRWAVKLGDLTALDPSDGGGRFPPEGGSGRRPTPRKDRWRGLLIHANGIFHLARPESPLSLCERHRDEAHRSTALYAHQDAILAVGTRGIDRIAHIADGGHSLAADVENHVTFLEALRCRALRIDLGHDQAVLARPRDAVCGSKSEADLRHVAATASASFISVVGI